MEAESGLRLLKYTSSWLNARLRQQALLEPTFIEGSRNMQRHEANWDPTTHFSRNPAGLQLCNCCHKLTSTWQKNMTKTFLFHPLTQTFLQSLRRTPNVSALKRHFGICFCRAEPSPNNEGWRVLSQDTVKSGGHQHGWYLVQGLHTWSGQD